MFTDIFKKIWQQCHFRPKFVQITSTLIYNKTYKYLSIAKDAQ